MSLTFLEFFLQSPFYVKGLMAFIAVGVLIEVVGLLSTFKFWLEKIRPLGISGKLPGVTIVKPCREASDNEVENFDAFFNQDYPGMLELLFVVGDESHPIVPIVKDYLKKYPQKNARLVISTTRVACSPKINSLYDGHMAAKGDIIIWSDSDVIIRPSYVTQMVASLQEPGVSAVTTPQYDTRANTFGSAYKVMANNADVSSFVMAYSLLNRRKRIAWGHSCGFWKAHFDEIGEKGWQFLNKFLADDLGLPMLFDDHGKKTVFRNIYCPVETANKTVAHMVEQKKRWVMCQRLVIGNRFVYLSGALFYPQIPALFICLLTGFSAWSLVLFFALALLRIFISALWELLFLNSLRMSVRYFWTILLWDVSQVYFFWHGFSTNRITFRGTSYQVMDDYFLSP